MKLREDQKPKHKASVDLSEVITIGEAAAYLNCHTTTLYRLAKSGEVPAFRLGGSWRFLRSATNKWIGQKHVQPPEKTVQRAPDERGFSKHDRKPKGRGSKTPVGDAIVAHRKPAAPRYIANWFSCRSRSAPERAERATSRAEPAVVR